MVVNAQGQLYASIKRSSYGVSNSKINQLKEKNDFLCSSRSAKINTNFFSGEMTFVSSPRDKTTLVNDCFAILGGHLSRLL